MDCGLPSTLSAHTLLQSASTLGRVVQHPQLVHDTLFSVLDIPAEVK